ncbi:phenazine-specific anthranilate synthase component I [Streptomyces pulveraceus]|uniref:anthranilate synthase n=1 Tax=Streptomyces pulveraceus TaxID=68258 RepID=A0ABW1GS68_9ACTN
MARTDLSTGPASSPTAAEIIGQLLGAPETPAFALLRRTDPETGEPGPVELLLGRVTEADRISRIPLPGKGVTGPGTLALVPFRQIRERGLECHDDATPLQVLEVERVHRIDTDELLAALPEAPVTLTGAGFDLDDDAYAAVVDRIVREEIARGTGANFVIRRDFTARLDDYGPRVALTLFRRLLTGESGAYWTFCVHTGAGDGPGAGRTLVGASPEAHVRVRGDEVVLNPISGTYRYPATGPDPDGLLAFLEDAKETDELYMVVDEELKMLCAVADRDVRVRGPFLREMAHLAHTEFEIGGRGVRDVREVLSRTMFAATVTGSPLESACRVIRHYEPSGRGYYAGALALFGNDADGSPWLDSPILIRTMDIAPDGALRMPVGATLVRDSDPYSEAAETRAKLAGVLGALGGPERRGAADVPAGPPVSLSSPRVLKCLAARRENLAPFWLEPGDGTRRPGPAEGVPGDGVLVIDAEDDFTAMLAHLLRAFGLRTAVHRYDAPGLERALAAHRGPVVLGPGPGNPDDTGDRRIARLRGLSRRLLADARTGGNPVLGICLGFQLLSSCLGLTVSRGERPQQGTQHTIDVFGSPATVGFYNSFSVRAGGGPAEALRRAGVELCRRPGTDEVVALRGPGVAGVQFHPESVLSRSGAELFLALMRDASREGAV